ncbi:MAG: methyl-accepting chemotaxis protein [Thermodesulfovibrionales bacterium]|nr:methyl-accepting chemotaxis protein [Thermodesulfovibrionales bacterium]
MTIKTKLSLNILIVLSIIAAVAITSIVAMTFVKGNLLKLTEKSTPFQTRTLEFQRALQFAVSELIKTASSNTEKEYNSNKVEAEKALQEVKKSQSAIESLAATKMQTYEDVNKAAQEIFSATNDRLKAEEASTKARSLIAERMKETNARLKELDSKIRGLQTITSVYFSTASDNVKEITSKMRSVEMLRNYLKDTQLFLSELYAANDKKAMIIARGKLNSNINRIQENSYVKENKNIQPDIKFLIDKIQELLKLMIAGNEKNKVDALSKEISEKLHVITLNIEQEIAHSSEKYSSESKKQSDVFSESTVATSVLTISSEISTLGANIEALTNRLFIVSNTEDVNNIQSQLTKNFSEIDLLFKKLDTSLTRLNAKGEKKIASTALSSLTSIKTLLLAQDGIVSKVKNQLEMIKKSSVATENLKQIVAKENEAGKKTLSIAQTDQEKSIRDVNRIVTFSTTLIIAISSVAIALGILFGIWVYRSISKPLADLTSISEHVSTGNLNVPLCHRPHDEIGHVQSSMCKMVANLTDIVNQLLSTTNVLTNNSDKLRSTAVSLEAETQNQTLQIEQSATAMTEMAQTTMDVAKNATNTSEAAQNMKKISLDSKYIVTSSHKEIEKFTEMVKSSAQKIESLGNKSKEINSIITLIKEIADQTNLLALNAAIEAARAGEQGRGFAVVADSVRQLAERTTSAADDISKTVNAMQIEVQEAVKFMNSEKESIDLVTQSIDKTINSIEQTVNYVEQVTDMVQQIAAATEEQSAAYEDVSKNMEKIAIIARHMQTGFTEVKNSAVELEQIASELKTTAGWFKV